MIEDDCRHLVRMAVREDLNRGHDWTTLALVPESARCQTRVVSREAGVLAGQPAVDVILSELEADLVWTPHLPDGARLAPGSIVGQLSGQVRDLLVAERPLLNLLSHLSGIATLTAVFVERVAGTGARIYDTRKTTPGMRRLEKYAVHCGGGRNHRLGLNEAVLIKDNHLAYGQTSDTAARYRPAEAVKLARDFLQQTLPDEAANQMVVEIEVDTLAQLKEVLPAAPDIILLDNMSADELRQAVELRDRLAPGTVLEASGGVTLQTIRFLAETGVDRISVGAITHSAKWLDLGLDWADEAP